MNWIGRDPEVEGGRCGLRGWLVVSMSCNGSQAEARRWWRDPGAGVPFPAPEWRGAHPRGEERDEASPGRGRRKARPAGSARLGREGSFPDPAAGWIAADTKKMRQLPRGWIPRGNLAAEGDKRPSF